jgi:hypothetical protein
MRDILEFYSVRFVELMKWELKYMASQENSVSPEANKASSATKDEYARKDKAALVAAV